MSFSGRSFVIGLTIALAIGVTVSLVFGAPFWIAFLIVVVAMVVNGFVAEIEDRERGL